MTTTSPQIMHPKCVLPMRTNSITLPLHTVHTGHDSAPFSVSIWCAGVWEAGMHVPTLLRSTISFVVAFNGDVRRDFNPVYSALCAV